MEWRVKNALSRDVEREHLNKILKEIRETVNGLQTTVPVDRPPSTPTVPATGTSTSFRLTLTGDVTGTSIVGGTGSSIPTVINPDLIGVEEAPVDGNAYWRTSGMWEQVPYALYSIGFIEGAGLVYYSEDDGWVTDEAPLDSKYYARKDGAWEEVMGPESRLVDYLGYGVLADRPTTPDLYAGALGIWLSTDTLNLSLWDGAQWVDVPIPLDLSSLQDAADDTAADLAGVPVGGMYRNGSALMVRVA